MTRYSKKNGKYNISGSNYERLIGTRAQVWHKTAFKTSGGLKKNDLFQNKAGRIVSKSKHASAKRENRLVKNGYGTKKGKFGFVKLNGSPKRGRKSRKMRGGKAYGNSFSPTALSGNEYDGQRLAKLELGSNSVQFRAGQAGGKGYGWLNSNGMDGHAIAKYINSHNSTDVQMAAGMAGGRKSKKMRGGKAFGNSFNPASLSANGIDGQGITNYGLGTNSLQFEAGHAGGKRRKRAGTMKQMQMANKMPMQMPMGMSMGKTPQMRALDAP